MNIAVVGEDNAGKSSFIKCALDMKSAPSSSITRKKMSLNGSIYNVRLLEIDLNQVSFDRDRRIIWPRMEKESAAPNVDGVLLLHDSTQPGKLAETAELTGMSLVELRKFPRLSPRISPHMCHPLSYALATPRLTPESL